MRVHQLKCWPEFFGDVQCGIKPFEVRKADRDYRVGDLLHIHEYDPLGVIGSLDGPGYTGQGTAKLITYMLTHEEFKGVAEGYVVLGLAPWNASDEVLATLEVVHGAD